MSGAKIPEGQTTPEGALKPLLKKPVTGAGEPALTGGKILPGSLFSQKSVFPAQEARSALSGLPLQQTQDSQPGKIIQTPSEQTVPAREVFNQTAAALGFPRDALTVALLAFARFFSLPPSLVGTLRRDILAAGRPSSPGSAREKAALEAEALAAILALDKGVELSPEILEQYIKFLTFPDAARQNPPAQNEVQRDEVHRGASPQAAELRKIAEKQAIKEDFLGFLNNIPGKNGQYWMVFPFEVNISGTELNVCLRILIREPGSILGRSPSGEREYLIADISGQKRQWRCFFEKNADKFRVDIQVYPECQPGTLKLLLKEAEQFLGTGSGLFGDFKGFEEISLRNGGEYPSWAEHLCAENLPSINEEI